MAQNSEINPSQSHYIPATQRFMSDAKRTVREFYRSASRLIDKCYDADKVDRPDSLLISDLEAIKSQTSASPELEQFLIEQCLRAAMTGTHSALDHLQALRADLERKPAPAWSTISTSRVILETAAVVHHTLAPEVAHERRQLRTAARLLHAEDENLKMADLLPDAVPQEAIEDFRRRKAFFEQELGQLGITRSGGSLMLGDMKEPFILKITDVVNKLTSDTVPGSYKLTSGVVHAQGWMLHEAVNPETGALRANANIVTTSIIITHSGLKILLNANCKYLGLGDDVALQEIDTAYSELSARFVAWRDDYYEWQSSGEKGAPPAY